MIVNLQALHIIAGIFIKVVISLPYKYQFLDFCRLSSAYTLILVSILSTQFICHELEGSYYASQFL